MLNLVLLCFYLRYFCTWYIRSVRATAGARRRNQKRTRGAPPSFPAAQYIQSMQCEMIQGRYCEPSERCCGHADSALITFQSVRLPAGTKVYSSKRYPRLISPDCRAGIRVIDGSLGGLGGCPFAPGATGNVSFEDLVYLCERKGFATNIDLEKLMSAREIAASAMPDEQLFGAISRVGEPRQIEWRATATR